MKTFELPKLPDPLNKYEFCGISLRFQEVKIRGTDKFHCEIFISENELANDSLVFSSWDEVVENFPTLLDLLKEIECFEIFNSSWREYERVYYIAEMEGSEGLYDIEETVWHCPKFDNENVDEVEGDEE